MFLLQDPWEVAVEVAAGLAHFGVNVEPRNILFVSRASSNIGLRRLKNGVYSLEIRYAIIEETCYVAVDSKGWGVLVTKYN